MFYISKSNEVFSSEHLIWIQQGIITMPILAILEFSSLSSSKIYFRASRNNVPLLQIFATNFHATELTK